MPNEKGNCYKKVILIIHKMLKERKNLILYFNENECIAFLCYFGFVIPRHGVSKYVM